MQPTWSSVVQSEQSGPLKILMSFTTQIPPLSSSGILFRLFQYICNDVSENLLAVSPVYLFSWMFRAVGFSDIGGTNLQTTPRHIPEHSYLHNHNHDRLQYHRSAIALKVGKSMEFRCENKISHTDFCFAKPLEIPRRWKDNIKTDLREACSGFGRRTVSINGVSILGAKCSGLLIHSAHILLYCNLIASYKVR